MQQTSQHHSMYLLFYIRKQIEELLFFVLIFHQYFHIFLENAVVDGEGHSHHESVGQGERVLAVTLEAENGTEIQFLKLVGFLHSHVFLRVGDKHI